MSAAPRTLAEHARDGVGLLFQHVEVFAENLDADGGLHSADQLIDAQRDRLRETRSDAGKFASASRIFSTSSSFDFVVVHSSCGLSVTITSLEFDPHRIGSDVGAASLGNHVDDFGKLFEDFLGVRFAGASDCGSEMLGMRKVCTAIEPSSSDGRNSVPMQRHEREGACKSEHGRRR